MNPTPLPTIYDITDIPYFAYTPGVTEWIVLGMGFALACGLLFLAPELSGRKRYKKAFRLAEKQLNAFIIRAVDEKKKLGHIDKTTLQLAAAAVKRLLDTAEKAGGSSHFSRMTPAELKERAGESHGCLKEVIEGILDIEQYLYMPPQAMQDVDCNLLRSLTDRVKRWEDELKFERRSGR